MIKIKRKVLDNVTKARFVLTFQLIYLIVQIKNAFFF